MKNILSKSKMIETMFVPETDKTKKVKTKKVEFKKGDVTTLSNAEYDYLVSKKNGPFNFLVKEGTFAVVDIPEEKPVSKKQQKKDAKAAKVEAEKKAVEETKARQGE